tara:strand:- start:96 stop:440 length:345 start_codon:yes stop_codon:yes gene_type:complete
MKTAAIATTLSVLLFITGCSITFKPWVLSNLTSGMTVDQVERQLGQPDRISHKDDTVIYHYTYTEPIALQQENIIRQDDYTVLPRRDEPRLEIKTYTYEVLFVDGKLMNYKERY